MSEFNEQNFKSLCKDVSEIKAAIIGSADFGQKGLAQRMHEVEQEVIETRRRTYSNENGIREVKNDVKSIKKTSGAIGAGSGGLVAGIAEVIKSIFT